MQSQYKRIVPEHDCNMSEIYVHGNKRREHYAGWRKGRGGIARFPLMVRNESDFGQEGAIFGLNNLSGSYIGSVRFQMVSTPRVGVNPNYRVL